MDHIAHSDSQSTLSLLSDGDELERETWTELSAYISLYETIWRLFSVPLRRETSIYFRDGIDPDLEMLAMCNYTAYVNMARALDKIKRMEDDLKFSEEIWANLQRAVEVGKKAAEAFENVCASSTGRKLKVDRRQLEGAEEEIKKYRNRLHHPVPATIKDDAKTRLIPRRELLEKYALWTRVMYHAKRDEDFVTVESQLRRDVEIACKALQSVWAQIKNHAPNLLASPRFQSKLFAGTRVPFAGASPVNPVGASGTIDGPLARNLLRSTGDDSS
jgi:hypothetical protein